MHTNIKRALGEGGFSMFRQEYGEQPTYALSANQSEAIVSMQLGSLANLERVFSAEILFESNIEAARALGLDHLVEAAQTIGPDFAPILADALSSPANAQLIDDRLATRT